MAVLARMEVAGQVEEPQEAEESAKETKVEAALEGVEWAVAASEAEALAEEVKGKGALEEVDMVAEVMEVEVTALETTGVVPQAEEET